MEDRIVRYSKVALIIFVLWSLFTITIAAELPHESYSAKNTTGEIFRIFPGRTCHVAPPDAPREARAAEFVSAKGERIRGCYVEANGMLHFRFDDGDFGRAYLMSFKPDQAI